MMESVLITGGSGFLGHALVERLLAEGCERICIYSRNEYNQARMRANFSDDSRLRWFIGDVRDVDRLEQAMEGTEFVIHAAALKRIEVGRYNPEEMTKTNVIGSMNVIQAARRAKVEKALLVSTDKAYQPVSPYGQSKAIAESMFLNANVPHFGPRFAVVRYGNVAGSTGSVIPTWRSVKETRRPVKLTNSECTRFWMDRSEAADLVVSTLRSMNGGELEIPELPAFRLGDLATAMEVLTYEVGLEPWEKMHESMSEERCSETAPRMSVQDLRERLAEVP